jgi:hypothetical protein
MNVRSSWRGVQAKLQLREGAEAGLSDAAEHIKNESQRRVPIEEATLERSAETDVDGLTAAVSYDTPYAVVQHEDTTLAHDPGRTAKYLETALNSERDAVRRLIARRIRHKLGG